MNTIDAFLAARTLGGVRTAAGVVLAAGSALAAAAVPATPAPTIPRMATLIGGDPLMAAGLSLIMLIGLFAWLIAAATVARPEPAQALATAAALAPAILLPGAGLAALLPPLALILWQLRQTPRALCIALAICIALTISVAEGMGWRMAEWPLAILTIAALILSVRRATLSGKRAANDNPLLKRIDPFPSLYLPNSHVTFGPDRIRGVGNHVHVQ